MSKKQTCVKNVEKESEAGTAKVPAVKKKNSTTEVAVAKKHVPMCAETKERDAIEKLRAKDEEENMNFYMRCEARINYFSLNYWSDFQYFRKDYQKLVANFRILNHNQGIRQESALKDMRDLKRKMLQDHMQEIQRLKTLIEEKDHLCTENKKMLQNLHEMTESFKVSMKTSMTSLRTELESTIKVLRNEYNSPLEISSPDPTNQNGTEVEGLQLKLSEEERQRTTIEAHLQTTNNHENNDADTTTNTIADDDAIDVVKSQDTMLQKTEEN